ncbi:MAG: hypothetical protein ACLFP4_00585 [Spirochaetales bacterium]
MRYIAAAVLLLASGTVAAQSTNTPIQRGFSDIELGMSLSASQESLRSDAYFAYRGEPDVSFSPAGNEPVIQAQGRSFVDSALFQFEDDELYIITLVLNQERLGYFSVYESLVAQYGEPDSLDPETAVWEDDRTTLRLERPLSVKYIDSEIFARIVAEGVLERSLEEVTREQFLEEL